MITLLFFVRFCFILFYFFWRGRVLSVLFSLSFNIFSECLPEIQKEWGSCEARRHAKKWRVSQVLQPLTHEGLLCKKNPAENKPVVEPLGL